MNYVTGRRLLQRSLVHIHSFRPLAGPHQQRYQSTALLLGQQAIQEMRRTHFQLREDQGRDLGQEGHLPVPGIC